MPVATASRTAIPSLRRWRVNSTIRMLLDTAMPTSITTPISDMTFSVVPGEPERQDHAGEAGRNGDQDDERIDEGPELRHQDQIQQHDREAKADCETLERGPHALHHAAQRDVRALGHLRVRR